MSAALPLDELDDHVRPLRRAEYDRLVDDGAFRDEKVELLEGFLVQMSPEGAPHAEVIDRLNEMLVTAVVGRYRVRIQHPLGLGDLSEPEPDVAVVDLADYGAAHPEDARLVIETASSSRRRDLGFKAELYARYGVGEYWVVDLDRRVVVVHREPARNGYRDVTEHGTDATLTPTRVDGVAITVAGLMP